MHFEFWISQSYRRNSNSIKRASFTQAEKFNINYVISQPYYLELLPIGSSKAEANRRMLEIMGKSDMKIFAIGDYYNDAEMIKDADATLTVDCYHFGIIFKMERKEKQHFILRF